MVARPAWHRRPFAEGVWCKVVCGAELQGTRQHQLCKSAQRRIAHTRRVANEHTTRVVGIVGRNAVGHGSVLPWLELQQSPSATQPAAASGLGVP